MSSFNAKLMSRINSLLEDEKDAVSYKEFIASVSKMFEELSDKPKKSSKSGSKKQAKMVIEKKSKREPTAYNIFYKTQAAKLKELHLNSRDLMTKIAELWQAEKLLVKAEDMEE